MEVLAWVFKSILVVILIVVLLVGGAFLYVLVQMYWPFIVGSIVGIYLWRNVNDNLAVIFFIASLILQLWWTVDYFSDSAREERVEARKRNISVKQLREERAKLPTFSPTRYHNMEGKRARYNKYGELVGYEDE